MFSFIKQLQNGGSSQAPTMGNTASRVTASSLIGVEGTSRAIVTRAIVAGDKGQVKFQGSWWTARCHSRVILLPGEAVQVLYRENLTLYVEPLALPTMSLQQVALSPY